MNILIVDDEKLAAEGLKDTLEAILGNRAVIETANTEKKAIKAVAELRPEIIFQDVEMPGRGGLKLIEYYQGMVPRANVIIITAYPQYALEALKLYVCGYLLKPANEEEVRSALEHLRYPLERQEPEEKPVYEHSIRIQCFGNFEIFVDEKPFSFRRQKTKELLAYLVDRHGAACSMGELVGVLYEDDNSDSRKSWLRTLIHDLRLGLREINREDVVIKGWNTVAVNCESFACDYYELLEKDPAALEHYEGEYMAQYSWAETSLYRW